MKKFKWMTVAMACLTCFATACDSDYQKNSYELACKVSGGSFVDEQCYCGNNGVPCSKGIACVDNGKQCATTGLNLHLQCEEILARRPSGVSDVDCSLITSEFELACLASGGISEDKSTCRCGKIDDKTDRVCDPGIICNYEAGDALNCMTNADEKECDIGSTTCVPYEGSEPYAATQKKCIGGVWKFNQHCENSCKGTVNSMVCGDCVNGEKQCQDDIVRTCRDGRWNLEGATACRFGCLDEKQCRECDPGQTVIPDSCQSNDDDGVGLIDTCDNGRIVKGVKCSNGNSCTAGRACGNCVNRDTRCTESDAVGKIDLCLDGEWNSNWYAESRVNDVVEQSGNGNWTIDAELSCQSLSAGYTEANGQFKRAGCYDAKTCADCIPGDTACSNTVDGSILSVCNAQGQWENSSHHFSCQKSGTVGECQNGQYSVRPGDRVMVKPCAEGQWTTHAEPFSFAIVLRNFGIQSERDMKTELSLYSSRADEIYNLNIPESLNPDNFLGRDIEISHQTGSKYNGNCMFTTTAGGVWIIILSIMFPMITRRSSIHRKEAIHSVFQNSLRIFMVPVILGSTGSRMMRINSFGSTAAMVGLSAMRFRSAWIRSFFRPIPIRVRKSTSRRRQPIWCI